MTTSDEYRDRFGFPVPPADFVPRHHNVNNGSVLAGTDPGPQPPDPNLVPDDPIARELQDLGDMAKRGINYQFAVLALLSGYAGMFRHVSQALSYLQASDLERVPTLRSELADAIASADRALNAPQQQAAE